MWFSKDNTLGSAVKRKLVSVRMEAIGGQGAHSAGKILAEAAVLKSGFSGNHFSSFGSEKRGAPVKSFVRFSTENKPIRTASHIQNPDVLIIFHESLLISHPEVLDGVNENTDLILNSKLKPQQLHFPKGIQLKNIVTLDATELAIQNQCGLNAVMLGAVSDFCREIQFEFIRQTLEEYFSEKKSKFSINNLKGFDHGRKFYLKKVFDSEQAQLESDQKSLPVMGWMNSPIGGIIINPGNAVLKDHSASRKGVAPLLIKEICFNCGYCDMVCPDFCFVWDIDPEDKKSPQLKGIDYQYCKGCQKCVAVCPVEALKPVKESDIPLQDRTVKAYPEIDQKNIENRWKHLDWVAYVDQLSESDRMMTLQTELLDPKTYLRPDFNLENSENTKNNSSSNLSINSNKSKSQLSPKKET